MVPLYFPGGELFEYQYKSVQNVPQRGKRCLEGSGRKGEDEKEKKWIRGGYTESQVNRTNSGGEKSRLWRETKEKKLKIWF